ncbi:pyrophosphatase PpaX [Fervidibacillus halotolerans]|uniref:Pyrophosphatase PpaX n=1 Tax=Fervidibacillus halotolerans TaxID=2980027 RepID=A0A9E8RZT2_9BACI|nr:pyrophosphatase PpaX [Fervidibacillus halotolerans]WAA11957.1 pyrophosphatase PpaX [Fervidibacillus halotolerans]
MEDNITTVLFDLDGTLVDTYELILTSFRHTFDHYVPGRFTKEDCISFIGPPLTETFASILPEKTEEMVQFYRNFNKQHHDTLIKPFAGVYDTVKTLHERGYKLAIVSTKMKDMVIKGLEATDLHPFFPVIIALDDVKYAKPDPEPIFKALELLRSDVQEAVMVGDSNHDILAAKNAGTRSVGVSWSIKGKDYLQRFSPDYMINHMGDLLKIVGVEANAKNDQV